MASTMWTLSSPILLRNSLLSISNRKNVVVCYNKPLYSFPQSKLMDGVTAETTITRRSANYQPSIWSYDSVQSFSSKYTDEVYESRAYGLKEIVKKMIREMTDPLCSLELIDNLQRLGIAYHFVDEISDLLGMLYCDHYKTQEKWNAMDMNLKALGFRLLRQHRYHVPEDILGDFNETIQNLNPYSYKDMVSMLNLYEASYHSFDDESILDDAREYTTKFFKENLKKLDKNVSSLVTHALELPLHWRVPRIEAKWYIKACDNGSSSINPTLMELAKLDFNMVQAIYQEDLKHASSWWKDTCWDMKFSFARDRVVENFLWTIGVNYLPRFSLGRRTLTKVIAIITTVDDVYDVYGTLDELEKFTDVIDRWDINVIEELPDYMKICFFGFYNSINHIAYHTLTNMDFHILPYLKKAWADLCKSYLVEAQWYHSGYTPTLEEYLDNACVSISLPVVLMHVNFLTSVTSSEEILQFMERADNIVRYSSLILRLADDLGTSSDEMARGDVPKSVQCYMHESGASEDEARIYIKTLINKTWKKLNEEQAKAKTRFSKEFIECAINLSRMGQFMYLEGDGHGCPDVTKSHVLSMLVTPIQGI